MRFKVAFGGAKVLSLSMVALTGLGLVGARPACADPPTGTKIVWRSHTSSSHSIWMMDPDGSNKIQLTDDEGEDGCPAISPDGTEIAFNSNRSGTGNTTLWLMNCDGTDMRPLVAIPGLNVQYPSWSPDGQRIIFCALIGSSQGGIWVVDRDGSNLEEMVCAAGYADRPFFSPDGLEIGFDKRTSSISYSHALHRMDSDGTNCERCTFGGPSESTTSFFGGYSPDGSMITYARGHGIWVADATCPPTNEVLLFEGSYPSNTWGMPSFSPDGEWLVFHHQPPGGDVNIYISRIDGSELTQLTFDPGSDEVARWGASCSTLLTDTMVVWTRYDSPTHSIWGMLGNGNGKTRLTDDGGQDGTPAVSPDGCTIAFKSDRGHPGQSSLWLMDRDGANLREVAAISGYHVQWPSWSPDSQFIVFCAVSGPSGTGIWRVDRCGDDLVNIKPGGYACRPFYSPDGLEILFDERTSGVSYSHQLFRMNADGSNVQQCTFGEPPSESTTTFCGGYSPDGSQIVYARGHGIWVADATCPVSGEVQLFSGSYPSDVYSMPSWSPDGQWITFDHNPPAGDANIFICRPDGSDLSQLTTDPVNDETARCGVVDALCLSPDCNGDGSVDVQDLLIVLAQWGPCPPICMGDVNSDGIVNVDDLLAVLAAWGTCP